MAFSRFVLADGAIFIEASVGDILTDTLEAREHACKSVLVLDIVNKIKTALEGNWGAKGLVLVGEADSESEITPPHHQRLKDVAHSF